MAASSGLYGKMFCLKISKKLFILYNSDNLYYDDISLFQDVIEQL